ncbi:MAG: phage terminase large subunit [Halomonas sp.]
MTAENNLPSRTELAQYLQRMAPAQRAELMALVNGSAGDRRLQHLLDFCEETTPQWHWRWHYQQAISEQFERLKRRIIDRLLLSVPPRHGKSELVTVRGAAHLIDRDPSSRVIIGAYSQFLANKFSRKTRALLRERGIPLSKEARGVDDWETAAGGGGRYAGMMGGVTGAGADAIGIDDPVKSRLEAQSPTYRERVWDAYKDDFQTRLEPGGIMWLIMTRWHEDDLAGRILASEEADDWAVINLPALAEEGDPLGRAPGEALCPERYDEKALERARRIMGATFDALYQGRPTAAEGGIIKRAWFRYFDPVTEAKESQQRVQSWDTATKAQEIHDYSVGTTWDQTLSTHRLRDVHRERLEYPELRQAVIRYAQKWDPDVVLIEDKGSGSSLIQDLRAESRLPVIAIEPEADKETRLSVESGWYASGMIEHPAGAPWLAEFEAELTAAPNGAYWDQCDSTSQYLRWAKARLGRMTHASTGSRGTQTLADFATDANALNAETGYARLRGRTDTRGF